MENSLILSEQINSTAYLKERLAPTPGEASYLHLSDLKLALESVRTERRLVILDYGCGGSPYRSLFAQSDYRRADIFQAENDQLDYRMDESSRVGEKDEFFDFILSTQVLEHVPDPAAYLAEAFRLLKKGGMFYLTTHGSYPDHGCPHDYRRWTAHGLKLDLEKAGFSVVRLELMTTGPRYLIQQIDFRVTSLDAGFSLFGIALLGFRGLYRLTKPWVHRMCDRHFTGNRVVTADFENHPSYVVVGCLAKK
jgi:SAM-dependent methyltransferase